MVKNGVEMKVLLLGNGKDNALKNILLKHDCEVVKRSLPLLSSNVKKMNVDFIISYCYRYIIGRDVLSLFDKGKAINLHISLLPYNRGADPNLWSFLEKTPSGVSIHCIDEGIDTGDVLCQEEVFWDIKNESLSSSYSKLSDKIINLFATNIDDILNCRIKPFKPQSVGTFHKIKDREKYSCLLTDGWNTSVKEIWGKALPDIEGIAQK
jgi:methionyl-tRNA formyltransferase